MWQVCRETKAGRQVCAVWPEACKVQLLPADSQRRTWDVRLETHQVLPETLETGVLMLSRGAPCPLLWWQEGEERKGALTQPQSGPAQESVGGRDCKMQLRIKFEGKHQEKKGQGWPIRLKLINIALCLPQAKHMCLLTCFSHYLGTT